MPKLAEAGSFIFVQSCARMMGAAWIIRQIEEASTAPGMSISGIASAMSSTVASDIGMAFELAVKAVAQGLSDAPDGEPQVLSSHELSRHLWPSLPASIQQEINDLAQRGVSNQYGTEHEGMVLSFEEYLEKHKDFLDRTVSNRYDLPGEEQWKSNHRFIIRPLFRHGVAIESHNGEEWVDGRGVLITYWWAIMKTACGLRWEDARCKANEDLAADRDEAWGLVIRAISQMLGPIRVMTQEELREKQLSQFSSLGDESR